MVWEFVDACSDAVTGVEVHYYQLVDQKTREVLDEKYVVMAEEVV